MRNSTNTLITLFPARIRKMMLDAYLPQHAAVSSIDAETPRICAQIEQARALATRMVCDGTRPPGCCLCINQTVQRAGLHVVHASSPLNSHPRGEHRSSQSSVPTQRSQERRRTCLLGLVKAHASITPPLPKNALRPRFSMPGNRLWGDKNARDAGPLCRQNNARIHLPRKKNKEEGNDSCGTC